MRSRRTILTVATLVLFLTLGSALPAHAFSFLNINDIASNAIGSVFYFISYVVSQIGAILFRFAALFTNITLDLNVHLMDSGNQLVYTGWGIMRDIANLGFVLVIIVIAFGTILRLESYNARKLLPRLIAAAILVNFSLQIAGFVVGFSQTITDFFTARIGAADIASSVAGAFNPQSFFGTKPTIAVDTGVLETLIVSIVSVVFVAAFTLAGAFTMLVLAGLLLLRFLHLSFLLIIAPITWLFWVIPALQGQFSKWWDSFFRWTFFAPAAFFFVYLALTSVSLISGQNKIYNAEAGAFTDILSKGSQMVILVGIMIGGLVVAQKMGIEAAGGAVALAERVGKGARAWAGRKTLQGVSAPFRRTTKKGGEEAPVSGAERVRRWASSRKTGLGRYAAGWVARGATRLATAGGEDAVKYHESQVAGMSTADAQAALLTATGPRLIALVKKLTQAKELGKVDTTRYSTGGYKALFERFNQGKAFGDFEKSIAMSAAMNEARGNSKEFKEAAEKLIKSFAKKDVDSTAWKDIFSGDAKFGLSKDALKEQARVIAGALATENSPLVASILPKLDKKALDNFTEQYQKELNAAYDDANSAPTTPENLERVERLSKAKENFKTVLGNYSIGLSPVAESAPSGESGGMGASPKPKS
jgi:hypothetical protein